MNETVKTLLQSTLWNLATVSPEGEPSVVPVAFKQITDKVHLLVGDVFLDTTLKNIRANGRIAVSAFDGQHLTGYQIKGHASYIANGPVVDAFKRPWSRCSKTPLRPRAHSRSSRRRSS